VCIHNIFIRLLLFHSSIAFISLLICHMRYIYFLFYTALVTTTVIATQHICRHYKQPTSIQEFDSPRGIPDSVKELGKKVFNASCYGCHKDSITTTLAPGQSVLSTMTPRAIFSALSNGKMRQQAINLSEKERKAVAQWLTNTELKENVFSKDAFTSFSVSTTQNQSYDYSGWGGDKEGTGFRTTAQAGITAENVASLKLRWAFAFPDATVIRSKPAVVGNWLIVGSQFGDVYAIDQQSGKLGWRFVASAAVRGAINVQRTGTAITAFFADYSTNVYAINVKTGKLIWNQRAGYEAQSATTGSVAVFGGKVFVPITSVEVASAANSGYECCSSSGGVVALSASTGEKLWTYRILPKATASNKRKDGKAFYGPSGAPVWCSPTVDAKRGLLYIGTGENYSDPPTQTSDAIQAINMKTGRLVWNFQGTKGDRWNLACPIFYNCPTPQGPDLDFGMAPILVNQKSGKDILVAGQKAGVVYALSPDDGKMLWHTRIGKGGALGGIHWGMATDSNYVYAANADNITALDRSDSSTKASPGIYALDLTTGKVIWNAPHPQSKSVIARCNSAAPMVIPGIVFAGSLDGHIRAYAAEDGKIIWDYNTATDFDSTVDGFKG
jgi:polyvinyl alcohol dehydrogenase (cytochrome)